MPSTTTHAWADAFRSSPDLTGVVSVYEDLRRKGLEFPMTDLDSLSPIHTPHRSVPDSDPAVRLQGSVRGLTAPPAVPGGTAWALPPPIAEQRAAPPPDSNPDGPITLSAEQLCSEMQVVRGNVTVMSEMMAEMSSGQVETSDLELLQVRLRTCRSMQRRVLELIPRVENEGLTEELLLINDDMNNIFMRYERMERRGRGGEEREVSDPTLETSLVSPAVIQSAAGSTVSGPPVGQSAVSSLSSQLASLNTGSSPASVFSTLQTLSTAPSVPSASKPVEEDEFDMFESDKEQLTSKTLADQLLTGVSRGVCLEHSRV
ncbi:TOM1-like protein 2 [Huso huso]|uniref:TOM1-like protein 2 n=1 Tax=Huso huso TaxID=61971 RepID=A0ABR0YGD9_HUSHU